MRKLSIVDNIPEFQGKNCNSQKSDIGRLLCEQDIRLSGTKTFGNCPTRNLISFTFPKYPEFQFRDGKDLL